MKGYGVGTYLFPAPHGVGIHLFPWLGGIEMITNKIKALLALRDLNFKNFADALGIAKQSLNNKAKSEAYKGVDLIKLADLTDTELCFIDKKTGKILISFDISDIKKPE